MNAASSGAIMSAVGQDRAGVCLLVLARADRTEPPDGHPPQGLGDDGVAHLGLAADPLDERDRDLDHPEAVAPGAPGQVDLEAVALGEHLLDLDALEDLPAIGPKAAGRVPHR